MLRPKARRPIIAKQHGSCSQKLRIKKQSLKYGVAQQYFASVAAAIALLFLLVNAVYFLWLPAPTKPSPPILIGQEMDRAEDPCEDYGCPIYPADFDEVLDRIQYIIKMDAAGSRDTPLSAEWNTTSLTRRSNRNNPPINQDAAIIIRPFRTRQTTSDNDFLMGIFDGHGRQGHHVSNYAVKEVPKILTRKFNGYSGVMTDGQIVQALKDAFIEADVNAPPTRAMLGGTTATVTLRRNNKIYLANAGDSRTIIVAAKDDNTVDIPFMTRFDKAHLPDEKARIEGLGGTVKYPPDKPQQSRVWVYSTAAHERIGLAMSRSIGDWEWGAVGVIAEPLVGVMEVTENSFVLAASDGMWDMRRPQFFAYQFASSLNRRTQHPLVTCYEVIEKISPKNETFYRDDITMIAMKL